MSDEMKLSQAEIDALLKGDANNATGTEGDVLSPEEADALGEMGNISFGSAATSLSALLQHRVDITTPKVSVIQVEDIKSNFPKPYVLVAVEFTEGLQGSNALAIELNDAKTIADLMLGGDGTNIEGDLNELHLSAVAEAMNQMMGGAATSMSQMLGKTTNISPPRVNVIDFATDSDSGFEMDDQIVNVEFQLRVGDLIDSKIMQLIPLRFAKDMVQMVMGNSEQSEAQSAPAQVPSGANPTTSGHPESTSAQESPLPLAHSAPKTTTEQVAATYSSRPTQHPVQVQQPEFMDFDQDNRSGAAPRNLALLYDVPLNVTVELGRAKRVIREILDLSAGSVLELDKLAGEPVDIFVNNKRIAVGEVVVIDENFGVRVTDIISQEQRVTKLSQ
ncbi:flagellar motor switch phosphatase FliY [Alicyclobacillus dauci]|uniref:Flagellar motor switch phosphatase FliY n=1 Tax=Alicyclobacillus dauci TaxID=1475485 RepID=A0ABY6YY09_9BACL|nr:flagellar motor switch phosphatase FliY [Alicyclobacillus dauci]WAH35395.1 flagellar motor switch phosphatase FliY [Alicyclobacillus dauci]